MIAQSRFLFLLLVWFGFPLSVRADAAADLQALAKLTGAPRVHEADGFAAEGSLRPLFYEGLSYRGKPTRVFAWLGLPAERKGKVPGIVLVHGGGGTAFKEWVLRWNAEGFAAIAMGLEGQTDRRKPEGKRGDNWHPHAWAGPARVGIYGDSQEPLADQWMYHAVANTILAHSLLRGVPEVDPERIGTMGISWGGVIVTTVIGIDTRFGFAIPTYGTGNLDKAADHYRRALADNQLYRELWEPTLRLPQATLPVLWFTWLHDHVNALSVQSATYRAAAGPRMISVLPDMQHGHAPAWTPPDSYAFAQSVVERGKPWGRMITQSQIEGSASAEFESSKRVQSAVLFHSSGTDVDGKLEWQTSPAEMETSGERIRVRAPLPLNTRAFFFNLHAGGLTLSSDFAEIPKL